MDEIKYKEIDARIKKLVPEILKGSAFTQRKLTDTPTDANQVVPRKYVNMNGSVAGRPVSSIAVVGQFFLDTNSNLPMWKVTAGWVNGVGSIISLNN